MLSNETVHKLREMHLGVMAGAFSAQLDDAQFQTVSFEDRFAMLVDAEWSARKSNRLTRLIRKAGYADPSACVENIEYLPERKLVDILVREYRCSGGTDTANPAAGNRCSGTEIPHLIDCYLRVHSLKAGSNPYTSRIDR